MRLAPAVHGVVNAVNRIMRIIVCVIIFVMMIFIVLDSVGRYLSVPLLGVVEITEEYLMIAIVFLGLGYTHSGGHHIRIEILEHLCPRLPFQFIRPMLSIMGALYFGFIAWAGWGQAVYAWRIGQRSASELGYPMAPAYTLVVVGSTIMCLWLLLDIIAPPAREVDTTGPELEVD